MRLTSEVVDNVVGADVFTVVVMLLNSGEEVVEVLNAGANNGWIGTIRSALVPVTSRPN